MKYNKGFEKELYDYVMLSQRLNCGDLKFLRAQLIKASKKYKKIIIGNEIFKIQRAHNRSMTFCWISIEFLRKAEELNEGLFYLKEKNKEDICVLKTRIGKF